MKVFHTGFFFFFFFTPPSCSVSDGPCEQHDGAWLLVINSAHARGKKSKGQSAPKRRRQNPFACDENPA